MFGIIKVAQGKALIVSNVTTGVVKVSFTGGFLIPVIHKAEIMDISIKTFGVDCRGADAMICRDGVRADVKMTFYLRVTDTEEDVLRVARSIGCDRASDQAALARLFVPKLSEALMEAGRELDFAELDADRKKLRDRLIELIGSDLGGFCLEGCTVDYLGKSTET